LQPIEKGFGGGEETIQEYAQSEFSKDDGQTKAPRQVAGDDHRNPGIPLTYGAQFEDGGEDVEQARRDAQHEGISSRAGMGRFVDGKRGGRGLGRGLGIFAFDPPGSGARRSFCETRVAFLDPPNMVATPRHADGKKAARANYLASSVGE